MVSRRKLRQQAERNSQAAQSSLANFKPAAPATPSYPNLGTRIGQPSRFTDSFNNAFAAARQKGLQQFEWNGKLYGTQLATQQKAPAQPAQNTPSADSLGWGSNQGPYRSAGTIAPTRGFDNRGAYSTTGGSFTNTVGNNPNYETSPQIRRYTPSFRFPGVRSNEKGGKLEDKQKAFVAYLIQASGVDSEDELNDYIQDLGQEGIQKELEKFEELMTQGTEQVPAAAKGAKLNYIKSLRGQCPDGFEMQYFKKGGVMCSQCIKKAQAQKATKAEKGTKVVQDFKADMKKCGGKMKGKMKKKEDGGKVKTIPGVLDTKENKLSPKSKVQIKKHYFGGKL